MRGGGDCESGTVGAGNESDEPGPDADDFFRLLSSRDRRRALYYLQEHSRSGLEELCDVLAGWRALDDSGVTEPTVRDRIHVSLHHTDLPLFESVGVVAYDRDARTVELEPLPEALSTILDRARAYDEFQEELER